MKLTFNLILKYLKINEKKNFFFKNASFYVRLQIKKNCLIIPIILYQISPLRYD